MARPAKKLDDEQTREVQTLAAVLSKQQIAAYFGMAENTFSAICERQPEVLAAYEKGKARAVASVAGNLLQQARSGNLTAMIFYLKTQGRWRETSHLDISNEDGTLMPPEIRVVPKSAKKPANGDA